MMCKWEQLLSILPTQIRKAVDSIGRDSLLELRIRVNKPAELVLCNRTVCLHDIITSEEIDYILNAASKYSPWCSSGIAQGYLTAPGGHRIGLCGEVVYKNNEVVGMKHVSSICIRIARDFEGISKRIVNKQNSILILGAPGWGKTTLLRDLIREISDYETISVVDERGELFPDGFQRGKHTDVLTGCPKSIGIERMIRTMGPDWIAVDEITSKMDCQALLHASNCGVKLLATAHAGSMNEFLNRPVYFPLVDHKIFQEIVLLKKDRSYDLERMTA